MPTFLRRTQVEPLAISARTELTALSVYRPLTGARIGGGVSFNPLGCNEPMTGGIVYDDSCGSISTINPNFDAEVDCTEFEPFSVHLELVQDNLTGRSPEEARALLDQHLRLWESAIIAREVLNSPLSDNSDFVTAADAETGIDASAIGALGAVTNGLAERIGNGVGMVHMTPGLFDVLYAQGAFTNTGGGWRTGSGHQVVADAGWVHADGTGYIYGSGPVYAATANEYERQTLNQASNKFSTFVKFDAIVAFETCTVVRAAVTSI